MKSTTGAEARFSDQVLIAALKRCATQNRGTQGRGIPDHGTQDRPVQKRKSGPGKILVAVFMVALCSFSSRAQTPATPAVQNSQTAAPSATQHSTTQAPVTQAPATQAPANQPSAKQAPAKSAGDVFPDTKPAPTAGPKADIIYLHGNVYTGVPSNTPFSSVLRGEAVAVRDGRIQAVGKNIDIEKLKGPQTQIVDLGGHFVMPGFNDAHLHLADAGLQRLSVDLTGVKTLDEMRERILAKVEKAPAGVWILGGGWDETTWPVKNLPSRWDLDEVASGHPVFLDRVDGHLAVANTRALQLASITLASRDPEGGQIDRDANGQPTGILRETAQIAVRAVIPPPTHDGRRAALEAALADLAEHGVTSCQDYSPDWQNFQIFEELEKEGKLTARISEWLPFDDSVDDLKKKRDSHPQDDLMLHTGMLKGFMDGSLGGHTAALLEPYSDDPKNSGLLRYEADKLNAMASERVLAGFQLGFHAIGDKGVQMALDAFAGAEKAARDAKVKAANGGDDYRLRIEHSQVTTAAEIARYKELKVIASMQPSHVLTDMRWAQDRLGPKRAALSYAWAAFLNKGVTLAFGTDYPVEPVSPFRGLYAAVTRRSDTVKMEYFPEQKITMDQAIAAYTVAGAFSEFEEKEKGKLVAGMLADFIVLDRDVTASSPDKVLATKVLRTVVGGKTVYESK
jgi:predicted amidohydrolase YtcJ